MVMQLFTELSVVKICLLPEPCNDSGALCQGLQKGRISCLCFMRSGSSTIETKGEQKIFTYGSSTNTQTQFGCLLASILRCIVGLIWQIKQTHSRHNPWYTYLLPLLQGYQTIWVDISFSSGQTPHRCKYPSLSSQASRLSLAPQIMRRGPLD